MCYRSGGDPRIHDLWPSALASGLGNDFCEDPSHVDIYRQRLERGLDRRQCTQSLSTDIRVIRH
jgi:hypothetical protein